jgi:4-hydroxybenzoyl-CoA reductase subunit beta
MMRLPEFRYLAPRSVKEAAEALAARPRDTMLLGGGTDVLPNMKRRQQVPGTLIGLRGVRELRHLSNGDGLRLGSGLTLTEVLASPDVQRGYTGLWQAAAQIATPHLRNMGTLGGNLCLDTRCNYYDQNYEWRKAINFCMKKDGEICWVATSSPRCLAVSSTDSAPMLSALGATVVLVSADGQREIALTDLYRNDGIEHLTRRPDEILTEIRLPSSRGWRSTYWKLRRRGSFDFPVLSVAAAARFDADRTVAEARIVLGAVSSCPMDCPEAATQLVGHDLSDRIIENAAERAAVHSRPMDNTDFALIWRKKVTRSFVSYALRELRGDDVRDLRLRIARQSELLIL